MPSIAEHLEYNRKELLDLSGRNRLLNIQKSGKITRVINVIDELSDEIFRILVDEKKEMMFLPHLKKATEDAFSSESEIEQLLVDPDQDLVAEETKGSVAPRALNTKYTDSKLQTSMTPEGLKIRLLAIHEDARTAEEEQGVNILYLALGQLEWQEGPPSKAIRFAPLVLIPVILTRESANDKFKLKWTEQELQENLSLVAKLKSEFGIVMPDFGDGDEDFIPSQYFDRVADVVNDRPGWKVHNDEMALGFFSFAKLMMFRDLEPGNWPVGKRIDENPLVGKLLADGFAAESDLFGDTDHLDEIIPVNRLDHVVDADSSQAAVIEIVRSGRNLVVQGPPGTGKSQTIVNILSSAVLDGKKVLFVAEKLAALQVVKRRLEANGLGALCLELHSNKANKKIVLEDLSRTWRLGRPMGGDMAENFARLERLRTGLNTHCALLHTPMQPSGATPFKVIGALANLRDFHGGFLDLAFEDAGSWSAQAVAELRRNLDDLKDRLETTGSPTTNPWRGVGLKSFLRIDAEPVLKKIRALIEARDRMWARCHAFSAFLGQRHSWNTLEQLEQILRIADCLIEAPQLDRIAFKDPVWGGDRTALNDLVGNGEEFAGIVARTGTFSPNIWNKDFENIRLRIARAGRSFFKVFSFKYREALADLRSCTTKEVPAGYDERMELLSDLIRGSELRAEILRQDALGSAAFGKAWARDTSDWELLGEILSFADRLDQVGVEANFRDIFEGLSATPVIETATADAIKTVQAFELAMEETIAVLKIDLFSAFGVILVCEVDLNEVQARSELWSKSMEHLPDWLAYSALTERIKDAGAGSLLAAIDSGILATEKLISAFEWQYNSELLRELVKRHPELGTFDGLVHGRKVDEFKEADRERLEISKLRTLLTHYENMPKQGDGVGMVGVIRSEMARKRGHMPLRKLLSQTSQAIQGLKPIFMMSPLSVAQYLVPGAVEFDLLVIDEASQVEPVDALGAVARCKQVVVVGDSKQLPPSTFFSKMTSDSDEDAEEFEGGETGASAKDIESVLSLCTARGIPSKMLQWHYRSRHHSLIAASNHEFYNDGLFIVPSPHAVSDGLGLKFRYVDGGIFDSGKTAVNRLEAITVAKAAIEHAKKCPDLTLGIAAFSIRQKEAILAELELLRQRSPGTEKFFYSHPNEPFFVKNLENVQGDERDVILISVGYGRNESGYFAMKFGPLGNDGGERRLNVLISRAKIRCEVYSSVRSEDIDLNRAKGRGVASLKSFLRYAETGQIGVARASGEAEDSPFEEAVRSEIERNGYTVDCQVGEAGFFIDLAVRNPDTPGSYVLGIECDGAAYHSSRSARDRDRLRQAVLEDHGWVLHRIWSTDWFQRPEREVRALLQAIEQAREIVKKGAIPTQQGAPSVEPITRASEEPKDDPAARPYQMSSIVVPIGSYDLAEMYPGQIVRYVIQVLETEAPISLDEVVVRVRSAFGYERAGNRLQALIEKASRLAIEDTVFVSEGGFFENRAKPVIPRRRDDSVPLSLRKPENLPPAEIRAAAVIVVERNLGVSAEQIATAVARLFGFKSTSSQLRGIIDTQVQRLLDTGILVSRNGLIQRSSSALPGTLEKG